MLDSADGLFRSSPQLGSSIAFCTSMMRRAGVKRSRHLRAADHPKMPVRAKLPGRHSEAFPKLLAKVVFGIESAAPRDLGNTKVSGLQKTRGLSESFFLEEMAQEAARNAMKTAGNVLPGVSKFFRDCFHGDFLVIADSSPDTLNEGSKEAVHTALSCFEKGNCILNRWIMISSDLRHARRAWKAAFSTLCRGPDSSNSRGKWPRK